MEAMRIEEENLEKELENAEPHAFSEAFEKKMEVLTDFLEKRWKRNAIKRLIVKIASSMLLCAGLMIAAYIAVVSL